MLSFLIHSIWRLILGHIIFKLEQKSGLKLFCFIYNFNFRTIIELVLLLIQGLRILALIAIIIASGFGSRFISWIFEDWLLSESELLFQKFWIKAERFKKLPIMKSNMLDAYISLISCIICELIYIYFWITSPFWISIFLSILFSIYIGLFWNENILFITWTKKSGFFMY